MMRYQKMNMSQLVDLLMRKKKRIVALNALAWRSERQSKEIKTLWRHVTLIRAEIECRKNQMSIPF